uniref:G protein-coupled receptor n=1 Tax=Heterorhabditis bacteriophora TaxID=37862 RepID=A0A1I7WN66_HETBA
MSFIVFTNNVDIWSMEASRIIISIFCSLFAQSLYLLALHFLYRYIQVAKPHARSMLYKPISIFFLASLHIIIAFDYGFVCYYNFGPSDVKNNYFYQEINIYYTVNISTIGYIGPLYFYVNDSTVEIQSRDLIGLLNVGIVIMATFAVIPFCGIRPIGNIVAIFLTIYPIVDPIILLCFISTYRMAVMVYLGIAKYKPQLIHSVTTV